MSGLLHEWYGLTRQQLDSRLGGLITKGSIKEASILLLIKSRVHAMALMEKKVEFLIGSPVVFFSTCTIRTRASSKCLWFLASHSFLSNMHWTRPLIPDSQVVIFHKLRRGRDRRIFHSMGETKKCTKNEISIPQSHICVLCEIELIIAWIPKNNGAWPKISVLFINGIVCLFDTRLHEFDETVMWFWPHIWSRVLS